MFAVYAMMIFIKDQHGSNFLPLKLQKKNSLSLQIQLYCLIIDVDSLISNVNA